MTECSLCDSPAVLLVVTPTLDRVVEREPVCAVHLADACLALTAQRGYATVRPLTYEPRDGTP